MRTIERMTATLAHRGPDDRGHVVSSHVALGHVRLAIVDLTVTGRQPMQDEDGRATIVYNGELYDFAPLRREIERRGERFRGTSDTEVLLRGYLVFGLEELLARIEGMFAFAIHDRVNDELHLVRDPFGMKPLYVREDPSGLDFASEPKALLAVGAARDHDAAALIRSLHHRACPAPASAWSSIRSLMPGESLTWRAADGRSERRVVSSRPRVAVIDADVATHDARVWTAIVRSVEAHLAADVPVGIFLSAGLDSGLIAAAAAELGRRPVCVTVSAREGDDDESVLAARTAEHFGFEHHVVRFDTSRAVGDDARLSAVYDEPFADSAALTMLAVSRAAREETGLRVVLSGDGGDEVFGGYRWYEAWRDEVFDERGPFARRRDRHDPMAVLARLQGAFSPAEIEDLIAPDLRAAVGDAIDPAALFRDADAPDSAGIDRLLAIDRRLFLPFVCLTKVDRAAMSHGLEVRLPYLHRPLIDAVEATPLAIRNPGYQLKVQLRRIARARLPRQVIAAPKRGFSAPITDIYTDARLRAEAQERLASAPSRFFGSRALRVVRRLRGRSLWRIVQLIRFVTTVD